MCGRFYVADDDALADLIRRLSRLDGQEARTGDFCPRQSAAVFVRENAVKARAMKWGIESFDNKLIINARSETAAQKPMFRDLMARNRLLVPAHGYYEWDRSGQKHVLGFGRGMYMAGLYRPNGGFVILTREAADGISHIHPRMPLIFDGRFAREWLSEDNKAETLLKYAETDSVRDVFEQVSLGI